jgi:CheY-like chemotaxis protein
LTLPYGNVSNRYSERAGALLCRRASQGISVPKILVADDNANIQKMVVLAFQDHGIQVVTVANGEAAVRRIPDLDPDLVLADIFMPVRNGYEVCEFIKKDERFSHIPVILLVGAFDPLDEKEARRVGADGVLKKPFIPPDPLIAMVMSALEKNPRVVAELAKAREAKEAPEPHPMPQLEIPTRSEPKTAPQFPEPSAEEAAIVYGFGSGRRAPASDKPEAQDAELFEAGDEAGDAAFDSAATSRDWRRTAMDFEVSAQDGNRPAFPSNDDFDSAAFPYESDAPPRHVRVMEPAGEIDSSVQDQELAPSQTEPLSATPFENPAAPVVDEPVAPGAVMEAEPFFQDAAAPESQPAPETVSESRTAHWMDAVALPRSDYPQNDWMNSLTAPPAEAVAATPMEEQPKASLMLRADPIESSRPVARTDDVTNHANEASSALVVEATDAHSSASPETEEPAFFADEAVSTPRTDSWFAPAPAAGETSHALESEIVSGVFKSDQNLEVDVEVPQARVAFRDPSLVESPAVHVTPEPLLIDEESHAPAQYGSRASDIPPAHSFFAPPSPETFDNEPAQQEALAHESHDETPAQPFRAWAHELNERTPTGPPPNREALTEIPFLRPPADFHQDSSDLVSVNSGALNVDDLVRKVLEKLEPQLRDLLSQGVLKPIVENILQSELAKKETTR